MSGKFIENVVEQACLGWLAELGNILLLKLMSSELRVKSMEVDL